MRTNDIAGIQFAQPKTFEERFGIAEQCSVRLDMKTSLLIDDILNTTCENYAAFPDRLYIIDRDGKVAYKGGRGPFGYKPKEMEQSLLLLMMEAQLKDRQQVTSAPKKQASQKPETQQPETQKPSKPAGPMNEAKKKSASNGDKESKPSSSPTKQKKTPNPVEKKKTTGEKAAGENSNDKKPAEKNAPPDQKKSPGQKKKKPLDPAKTRVAGK